MLPSRWGRSGSVATCSCVAARGALGMGAALVERARRTCARLQLRCTLAAEGVRQGRKAPLPLAVGARFAAGLPQRRQEQKQRVQRRGDEEASILLHVLQLPA